MEKHRRSAFWQKEAAEKAAAEANEKSMQEQWRSQSKDSAEQPHSAFTFTPFKEPSGNRVEIADPPAGTLKRPTRNPNYNTLQPTKPSLKFEVRPEGTAGVLPRELSRTWGRPGGGRAPQMGSMRSSSVMANGPMTMGRPISRQSEVPIGMTRYQSYCTLPRPEEPLDTENLVAAHLAAQQQSNVFYVPFQTYSMPPAPPAAATLPRPPPPPQPHPVSLPPPSAPPPPSFRPPVTFYSTQPEPTVDRRNDLVPWEAISIIAYMHILFSICIFGAGGYRILYGAKWAIGIEMIYAILVLINACLGIYAVNRRHLQAVVATFVLSAYNLFLAIIPILIGLMPWFGQNSPSMNPLWFASQDEPYTVDYCLSVLVAVEAFACGLTVVYGCRSIGNALFVIDDLRSHIEREELRTTKA